MSRKTNNYRHENKNEVSNEEYERNINNFRDEFKKRQVLTQPPPSGVHLTTNFLKVDIDREMTFYVYPVEYETAKGGMFLYKEQKDQAVNELSYFFRYHKKDVVVTQSIVVSPQKQELANTKKIITIKDREYDKDVRVRFEEEVVVKFDGSTTDYQELEQVLNNVLHEVLSNSKELQATYSVKMSGHSKHYWGKKPIMESKNRIRGIQDTWVNKQIFQTYNISFTGREKGWYLLVSPNFRVGEEPFSGLESLDFIFNYHCNDIRNGTRDQIRERITKVIKDRYYVKFLRYCGNRRTTKKISKVRYDLNPFSKTDFGEQTYVEYYLKCYPKELTRIGITKPEDFVRDQPLFQVDPDVNFVNRSGKESLNKPLYYIPQLVGIAPESDLFKYKLDWATRNQRESVDSKINKVRGFIDLLKVCLIDKKIKKYGINVDLDRDLERCESVTLPTLTLHNHFHHVVHYLGQGTKWEKNMRGIKLRDEILGTGKKISFKNIVCVYCDGYEEEMKFCLDALSSIAYSKWIDTPYGNEIKAYCLESERGRGRGGRGGDHKYSKIIPLLEKIARDDKPDIIIMIPDERRYIYNDFISFCMERGFVEQVIRGNTIRYKRKLRDQIMYNVFLQIYCKLGGFLWNVGSFLDPFIRPKETNTMLLGIDASRETRRSYFKLNRNNKKERMHFPSSYAVVAVVLEKEWTCRQGYLLKKEKAQEISRSAAVDSLQFFIEEFRKTFREEVDRIVVFRDGVANTQVEKLREKEIDGMIDLLKKISPKTEFSYILIQKRVKAFFCTSGSRDQANPDPGSVVSTGITFSQLQISSFYLNTDFYLISSTGSGQYSSRPCHYLLLHNSSQDVERELQKLTFACCNLYFGFRGTIKTPFVAQLAHKLADKIYKSVLDIKRADYGAKRLNVKTKILCMETKQEFEGDRFEDVKGNVRICVHKNFYDKFFEL